MQAPQKFIIKNYLTQSGAQLDLEMQFRTYGTLSVAKDNAVLLPTFYGGRDLDTEYFFAPGRALDPSKHFIIVVNMFGNGASSSPSNIGNEYSGTKFPSLTIYDNVLCQQKLVANKFKIKKLQLVTGFSLGAAQSMQWASLFPEMVNAVLPICGAARISPHNKVFIESAIQVLQQIPDYCSGEYKNPPENAINGFGHVYAAWLFSQDFFATEAYKSIGLSSPDEVVEFTKTYFKKSDANDLVSMAKTWTTFDISNNEKFKGDFEKALRAMTSKIIVMPADTDLYFRVSDNAYEVSFMPNATLKPLRSDWGHAAGFGMNQKDNESIDAAISELLRSES